MIAGALTNHKMLVRRETQLDRQKNDLKHGTLNDFNVIGRKQPVASVGRATSPPAFINLLAVCDYVTRVKLNLRLVLCQKESG